MAHGPTISAAAMKEAEKKSQARKGAARRLHEDTAGILHRQPCNFLHF